jgi:hypothetical protein
MAIFIAAADGNLSSAGAVWGTTDATSNLVSSANNTALTTSYVESQAFTPGAITVDGFAVMVWSRASSPTGTMSCRLAQAGALVAGTEVTINVSDIELNQNLHIPGWYFLKFAAPVTLLAATPYTLSAKTSSAAQVNLTRNATAGNWCRLVRTTTLGNPGAADDWHVLGEWTAAGTKTNRAVTMDETAATDYGSGSTDLNLQGVSIGKGGTLSYGNAAATNYVLRMSTGMRVWKGGVFNIGTLGAEIPRDSTAILEFDCAADGDFGLLVDGTFNSHGLSRTAGKNVVMCKLNTDEAAGQTVLGVDTDTGWKNGDGIVIASTTRTFNAYDAPILAADAGASSITVSAGLTNAHSGTSPTQAEVALYTRNVTVRSVSSTAMSFVVTGSDGVFDARWTRFTLLGVNTDYKMGVQLRTTVGSSNLAFCSIDTFENFGLKMGGTSVTNPGNLTMTDCVLISSVVQPITAAVTLHSSTNQNITLNRVAVVIIDGSSGNRHGFEIAGVPYATLNNLTAASCEGSGFLLTVNCKIDGLTSHSNASLGVTTNNASGDKWLYNVQVWRNNAGGINVAAGNFFLVETGQLFGNLNHNTQANTSSDTILRGLTVAGDTSFATLRGFDTTGTNGNGNLRVENCDYSPTSGIFVPHTTADIDFTSFSKAYATFVDTFLRAATEIVSSSLLYPSFLAYQRHEGVTNIHATTFIGTGATSYDTATFRTASPSEKLAPSGAFPIRPKKSEPFRVRVNSGSSVNVAVYVQKDASYSGHAPRLWLKANAALGVNTDTLLDTFGSPINTWEQLTGTTPVATEDGVFEFFVDASGTGGAIYVDDWSAS